MSKPHKHAELIKAWADGAEIEIKHIVRGWTPMIKEGEWLEGYEYRIKPAPKPNWYRHYMVMNEGDGIYPRGTCEQMNANLKLFFDGETGELKSAEVLK